jgi:hypothetical protein
MPISGSMKAPTVARLNVGRLGAKRLGYAQPTLSFTVNGIPRNTNVRIAGLSIRDELDSIPNTCTLRVDGFVPSHGDEIKIYLGDTHPSHLLFAGRVLQCTQVYDLIPAHLCYDLSAISYEWELNRHKVTARYLSESATAIVLNLIATWTTGFSTVGVQTGLETLDEITFTNEDVTDCLDRIAARIGAHWVLDYMHVLHFGIMLAPGGTSTAHGITDGAGHGLIGLAIQTDLSQVRTRVLVEGGGSVAAADVAIGETLLPIVDPVWYPSTGGTVVSGPQRLTYTGVSEGGAGSLVGASPLPTNAPTLTLATGTGVDPGIHSYTVTFGDAAGDSVPGPSAAVTIGSGLPPPPAPTAAAGVGTGLTGGSSYRWVLTYHDGAGHETTAGDASASVVMTTDIANPTTIGTAEGWDVAPGTALDLSANYSYKYTFRDPNTGTETAPSPASNTFQTVTFGEARLRRANVQIPPLGYERRFYRTEGGGSTYKLMSGPSDGFASDDSLYYYDTAADGTLGVTTAPTTNSTGRRQGVLTNLPTSGTLLRKLYRSKDGGGYGLIANLNATDLSYTDAVPDGSVGAPPPGINTLTSGQVVLSDIALGPPGTMNRKLWRTAANASSLKLLATLANNTTTTHTDAAADAMLGVTAPTSNTSGLIASVGQVNAGETAIPITGAGPFRSLGGWAQAGGQLMRYTGVTATTLTGIPATGPGSVAATLNYGTEILAASMLTGIPASGAGSVAIALGRGDDVNVLSTRNDPAAQTALAALVGGDGIVEDFIQDRRLSEQEAENRGDARLLEVKDPEVRVSYATRDQTTRSGRTVSFTLTAPDVSGTFRIQRVVISDFDPVYRVQPVRQVEASSRTFTLDQLLHIIKGT